MQKQHKKGDLITDLTDHFLLCFCFHSVGLDWIGLGVHACVSGNTSARTNTIKFCRVTSFQNATPVVQSNHDYEERPKPTLIHTHRCAAHIKFIVVAIWLRVQFMLNQMLCVFCTFILIFTVIERHVCLVVAWLACDSHTYIFGWVFITCFSRSKEKRRPHNGYKYIHNYHLR